MGLARFELDPDAPSTYSTPNLKMIAGNYRTNEAGAIQHQHNVAAICTSEGIDFQWGKVNPGNTRLAHRIIQVARAGEVLFEAYMNKGEAIGARSVIERIAVRIGLSTEEIDAAISSTVFNDQIAADQQTAMEIGVTGVPFFVITARPRFPALSRDRCSARLSTGLYSARSSGWRMIRQSSATLTVVDCLGPDGGFGPTGVITLMRQHRIMFVICVAWSNCLRICAGGACPHSLRAASKR